jgi:signal recognition particle GTPase
LKEIRRALVDADVNYKIAKEFTDKVKTGPWSEGIECHQSWPIDGKDCEG